MTPPGTVGGCVALVGGGAGAVGAAISRRLAAAGHRVAVQGRSHPERAEALAAALPGGPHTAILADLRDPDAAAGCVTEAAAQLGEPPLVVVNTAATAYPSAAVVDVPPPRLEEHLDTVRIHHHVFVAAVPAMRAHGVGRIVSVTGALASRPFDGLALQGATRAAINLEARTLALEEGRHGITVNVVMPGHVRVDQGAHSTEGDPAYARLDEISAARSAQPLFPTAEDIAEVVAFLVSDAARAVTGQVIQLAAGEPM